MKKLLPLLLLAVLPSAAQAQFTYVTNNGAITITGYTGPRFDVAIPDFINGYPVTSIQTAPFANSQSLTNVTFGTNMITIGAGAFAGCGNLRNITLPNSVVSLVGGAFAGCGLTSIYIPGNVATIGVNAFGCSGLTNITVDPLNATYSSVDRVLFDKSQARIVLCPQGRLGNYTVPDTVRSIDDSAFASCSRLESVTFGSSLTRQLFSTRKHCHPGQRHWFGRRGVQALYRPGHCEGRKRHHQPPECRLQPMPRSDQCHPSGRAEYYSARSIYRMCEPEQYHHSPRGH